MLSEIEIWHKNFTALRSPIHLFGALPKLTLSEQEKWLKGEYRRWQRIVHPDRSKPSNNRERIMCTEMLEAIKRLYEVAVIQIQNGIYEPVTYNSAHIEKEKRYAF